MKKRYLPKSVQLLMLGLSVIFMVGCLGSGTGEQKADVANPNQFSKSGLSFKYPGNWEVTEDQDLMGYRYLFVESPGESIVVIQIFSREDALDLEAHARDFSGTAKDNTEGAIFGPSEFGKVVEIDGGQTLTEKFSVTVAGETMKHTRSFRRIDCGAEICFVLVQAADVDLDLADDGFNLINESFSYRPGSDD